MPAPLVVINPATGQTVAEYPAHAPEEIRTSARQAAEAWQKWRRRKFADRAEVLRHAAMLLRRDVESLATTMATEMGKPIVQGRAEVEKCAWVCEHYAEHGARYLGDVAVATGASESFVTCQPLGTVLAIMPWNFPLWQVFRAAAPTLMAGNVMLLKHASNVPGSALAIERIWREAGAPAGVFTTLLIDGAEARKLLRSRWVQAVTLTGSTPAGRAVAREAGNQLKKSVLELGGSDSRGRSASLPGISKRMRPSAGTGTAITTPSNNSGSAPATCTITPPLPSTRTTSTRESLRNRAPSDDARWFGRADKPSGQLQGTGVAEAVPSRRAVRAALALPFNTDPARRSYSTSFGKL